MFCATPYSSPVSQSSFPFLQALLTPSPVPPPTTRNPIALPHGQTTEQEIIRKEKHLEDKAEKDEEVIYKIDVPANR